GVRTWGGVIGIDGRYALIDGTSVTPPRYATWIAGKGWGVEDHGVGPDIEVVHTPAEVFPNADAQLDRAIDEALRRLPQHPACEPGGGPEPGPPVAPGPRRRRCAGPAGQASPGGIGGPPRTSRGPAASPLGACKCVRGDLCVRD